MKISDLGLGYPEQLKSLGKLSSAGLWQDEAAGLLTLAESQDFSDTHDLLETLHQIQRLHKINVAGLADNAAFRQAVVASNPPTWKDFGAPPVADDLQISLAQKLYNADPINRNVALVNIGNGARLIGEWLVDRCRENKIPFMVNFVEDEFADLVEKNADIDGIKRLAADYVARMVPVKTVMTARPGHPEKEIVPDKEKSQLYKREVKPFSDRVRSGEVFYTLTEIPTVKDAEINNMPYKDYVDLFFEMCDQPWEEVGKAQAELIKEFNAAAKVRITNDDGTDISFSLIADDGSHFTFCNSLIAKNVPGSEVFSAPNRLSAQGKIVAKGRFSPNDSEVIENLTMEFEKGKLVRYAADNGIEVFEKALVDPGAYYLGELAFGTNPHLKQHVISGLLVEKIGGSFHVALGQAYSYTEYGGVPVKVDNGNESAQHWDITTMLNGKGGKVYLDDRLVMDNGKWLDTKYDVLNRGWEAIPEEKRPAYWQDYYKRQPKP